MAKTILRVNASARQEGSISRTLGDRLTARLTEADPSARVVVRDLADEPLPQVTAAWVAANFTPDEDRTEAHRATLALSDALVAALKAADVVVISTPMYNFGIPAALKAWVDLVARARLTFKYTDKGPVGLLEGKKAYVLMATGGAPVHSPVDFATPYLRHVLGFLGITDLTVIAADRALARGDEATSTAIAAINDLTV